MKSARALTLLVCGAFGAVTVTNEEGCAELPDIVFVDVGPFPGAEDGSALGSSNGAVAASGASGAMSDASDAIEPDAQVAEDADAGTPTAPIVSSSGGGSSSSGGAASWGSSSGGGTLSPAVDAGGVPSSPSDVCPLQPPPGANACCGMIPCVGLECDQRCFECFACAVSAFCCLPSGVGKAPICAATASACATVGHE